MDFETKTYETNIPFNQAKEENIFKLGFLNKLVENQESQKYSKLHFIYMKYFPEWSLNSKKLITSLYKRMLKKYPEDFVDFSSKWDSVLEEYILLLKNQIVNKEKIYADYDCMRNVALIILNCIHYIFYNKKLTIDNFLNREKFNYLHDVFLCFFSDFELIKSIYIQLFEQNLFCENSSEKLNKTEFLEKKDRDISFSCKSELLKASIKGTIKSSKSTLNQDYVYIFYLFLGFVFPNHLEVELKISMSSILKEKKTKNMGKFYRKYEIHFLVILLTTYFISKDEKIQRLKLNLCESLKLEMDFYLQYIEVLENTNSVNSIWVSDEFIYMDNFFRNFNFYYLKAEINSLDPFIFERINIIAFKNIGIRSFNLKLFNNDYEYNDKSNLLTILNTKINSDTIRNSKIKEIEITKDCLELSPVKVILPKRKSFDTVAEFFSKVKNANTIPSKFFSTNSISNPQLNDEEYDGILKELFSDFDKNLKNLYFIIQLKANDIKDLKIVINPPNSIRENREYLTTITGFIYNILKMIANNSHEISSLEIESNVSLNYLLLGIMKDKEKRIDLRKSKVVNLVFNLKLDNYYNVLKFIPEKIVYLKLVDLSCESFICLVDKLGRKFVLFENLVELALNIVISNREVEKLIKNILEFFRLNKPKRLEILRFSIKYILKNNDIMKIISIIDNKNNSFQYKDKLKLYFLDFCLNSNNYSLSRKMNFCRFDEKNRGKVEFLLFSLKKWKIYDKVEILKRIIDFSYTYTKVVKLE